MQIRLLMPLIALSIAPLFIAAQDTGDEDKHMSNLTSATRDKIAIQEAKSGWWKTAMLDRENRIKWWQEARFGMFIHWGVYSEAGGEWKGKEVGGYAEHLMRKEKITRKDYLELASKFNPTKFNAEEWVKSAKAAGMHYMVITAKHHDGFAMYPSAVSDFDIADQTPFKRDPMAELAAACKKYRLKFGFYYSHAFDWEHPDAPGNDWEFNNPGGDKNLYGGRNWFDAHPGLIIKAAKYVDEKSIPQIKELIQKYHPDMLWFDTPHKLPFSENLRILKAIRETDPNLVINGRLARNAQENFGDYLNTADRPAEFFPVTGDWEAIPTTNESYGYSKYDNSHKSASHFIRLLANAVSRGGNLLMNIGPKGDGRIDTKDQRILDSLAIWMKKYENSIYKASSSPLPLQSWGAITRKDNLLYLHVFDWPKNNKLLIGGLKNEVVKVYSMADQKKLALKTIRENGDLYVLLPKEAFDRVDAVLVMEIKPPLEAGEIRYIDGNITNCLLAFDAEQKGRGFGFGDGKTNKYYVHGWKSKDQSLSWTFQTIEDKSYQIVLKYIAGEDSSGTIDVLLGSSRYSKVIESGKEKPMEIIIGNVKLSKGTHHLKLQASEITGKELTRVLEVDLIPIN